jgi:hypothetical protein
MGGSAQPLIALAAKGRVNIASMHIRVVEDAIKVAGFIQRGQRAPAVLRSGTALPRR